MSEEQVNFEFEQRPNIKGFPNLRYLHLPLCW